MLIVVLAAGLLTHFFPCCAFAIHSFSKVSVTPVGPILQLNIKSKIASLTLDNGSLISNS